MATRRGAIVGVMLVAIMTRDAAAQQLGSFRSAVNARLESQGSLAWSGTRPLVRSDFEGNAPNDTSVFAAAAAVGLLHAISCDADHFEFTILPFFMPDSSWTRPDALLDTPERNYQLAHEQGHFDLTEISARQLRAELSQFNVACDSANAVFTRIAEVADTRHAALQVQYDAETMHALNKPEQERWFAMIRAALDTLPPGTPWTNRRYWRP